jgi:hypothetical protein
LSPPAKPAGGNSIEDRRRGKGWVTSQSPS